MSVIDRSLHRGQRLPEYSIDCAQGTSNTVIGIGVVVTQNGAICSGIPKIPVIIG